MRVGHDGDGIVGYRVFNCGYELRSDRDFQFVVGLWFMVYCGIGVVVVVVVVVVVPWVGKLVWWWWCHKWGSSCSVGGAVSGEARVVVVVLWVALGWREGEDREIEMTREK